MVNVMVMSLLAAQAAATAPAAGGAPSPAGPDAAQERKEKADRVKETLGAQGQPFPTGGLNVGSLGSVPVGNTAIVPAIAVIGDFALGYTTLSTDQQLPLSETLPQHKAWPYLQE